MKDFVLENFPLNVKKLSVRAIVCCGMTFTAMAQNSKTAVTNNPFGNDWKAAVSAYYTTVYPGEFNFRGIRGTVSAYSADADISVQAPLDEHWFVPADLTSCNVHFNRLGDDYAVNPFVGYIFNVGGQVPVPYQINTLGLDTGLGYQFNKQWTVVAQIGPRLYNLDTRSGNDMGVGGMFQAVYNWTSDLTVAIGLSINPDCDVPVLPAGGLNWKITTNLDLGLMFPKSELDYYIGNRLTVFSDFDAEFTVFRTEDDLGNRIGTPPFYYLYFPHSEYNNALGTYRDFHAGAGVEYRIYAGLSASVEGGYSFERELDYQRIGETLRFDSAPYVQAGLKYRF